MEIYDNLYCKIFIDTDYDMDFLVNKINEFVQGQKKLFRTIETKFGEIDIKKNKNFNLERRLEKPDGFLYYRFYLDIEPADKISQEEYIDYVSDFLEDLWKNDFKAIAACDFEEELPRKGGYNYN